VHCENVAGIINCNKSKRNVLMEKIQFPNSKSYFCMCLSFMTQSKDAFYKHRIVIVLTNFSLQYDLNEDVGYEAGSEEGSVEEALPPKKRIQPLLYILLAQPYAFLSRSSSMRKVQVC
jgi:hypothetical protein